MYNTGASAVWSHLLLVLTMTTWGQYCHIERGGGGCTCNHLVKVKMKQLSVQDALHNKSINNGMAALYSHLFVQSEKSNIMSLSDSCGKR